MRELIIATVGAAILITLGLATVSATENERSWGNTSPAFEESATASTAGTALHLAN